MLCLTKPLEVKLYVLEEYAQKLQKASAYMYDQQILQSQTTNQPMALRGRNAEHSYPRDSKNTF